MIKKFDEYIITESMADTIEYNGNALIDVLIKNENLIELEKYEIDPINKRNIVFEFSFAKIVHLSFSKFWINKPSFNEEYEYSFMSTDDDRTYLLLKGQGEKFDKFIQTFI